MPRKSARRNHHHHSSNGQQPAEDEAEERVAGGAAGAARQLPAHIRDRQRAVAEREAARLARPERRAASTLGHADRKKSAVTSTPFGILSNSSSKKHYDDIDNNHETTWCGPFTIARQMIAGREQAKREREAELEPDENARMRHPLDAVMEQLEEERQQKAHPSLLWKSRANIPDLANENNTHKKKKPRLPTMERKKLPSLYQLCINFVVSNFEHVESLGQVDHSIRTTIAHELAGLNQLDHAALKALVEPGMEALELIDCADIPQEALCEALQQTPTLRYLILDQAGRCFGPKSVETILNPYHKRHSATSKPEPIPLFALNVGGAYLLRDSDAARLTSALSSTLQSLAFKACSLLGTELCQSVYNTFSQPSHTLLEFALEDMTLNRTQWELLAGLQGEDGVRTADNHQNMEPWQRHLKSLTLKRVTGLKDDIVIPLIQGAPDLEHLDLSDNFDLTDDCLSTVRSHATSSLRSLHLSQLRQLTHIGLETLFTPGLENMAPPPQLKIVNLNHLDEEAVTDHVMELILQAASRKPTGKSDGSLITAAESSGLSLLGGMKRIEVQSSAITDHTLELIAATCAKTLEHLNVSFCSQISDKGLGYLVDQVGSQLEQVQIWGNAQITQDFWNGHSRVFDAGNTNCGTNSDSVIVPLQITGAWMKKSGVASIRT